MFAVREKHPIFRKTDAQFESRTRLTGNTKALGGAVPTTTYACRRPSLPAVCAPQGLRFYAILRLLAELSSLAEFAEPFNRQFIGPGILLAIIGGLIKMERMHPRR